MPILYLLSGVLIAPGGGAGMVYLLGSLGGEPAELVQGGADGPDPDGSGDGLADVRGRAGVAGVAGAGVRGEVSLDRRGRDGPRGRGGAGGFRGDVGFSEDGDGRRVPDRVCFCGVGDQRMDCLGELTVLMPRLCDPSGVGTSF